ncbi:MAG: hypothetical protein CL776_04040 [Chloroflexi bacterium]|nr:hypothetical protein [Chloroflexota bacterium]|tara:strand:+ start:3117 stop:3506 length:390 start_codon:yes stop_codon:yes gene_type:complete
MIIEPGCEFCGIVSGKSEAEIKYQDDDLIVFRNILTWVPIMLLVAPNNHLSQTEFWTSKLFQKASNLAVEIGASESPEGFRILSNFGDDALQTQVHAHLHVLGGTALGLYVDFKGKGDFWARVYGGNKV